MLAPCRHVAHTSRYGASNIMSRRGGVWVQVCAFDRLYTLGPDVLAHLRNQPFADANLLTKCAQPPPATSAAPPPSPSPPRRSAAPPLTGTALRWVLQSACGRAGDGETVRVPYPDSCAQPPPSAAVAHALQLLRRGVRQHQPAHRGACAHPPRIHVACVPTHAANGLCGRRAATLTPRRCCGAWRRYRPSPPTGSQCAARTRRTRRATARRRSTATGTVLTHRLSTK